MSESFFPSHNDRCIVLCANVFASLFIIELSFFEYIIDNLALEFYTTDKAMLFVFCVLNTFVHGTVLAALIVRPTSDKAFYWPYFNASMYTA